MITPATCRAARGLLSLTQADLAALADVGLSTVRNYEVRQYVPNERNLGRIQTALETGGVEFIGDAEASSGGGVGVRLSGE